MAKSKNEKQRTINIERLKYIRDNDENLSAVRLQAVQTLQKLISEDDPLTEENIEVLIELRDSEKTGDGVRIQVIQTLQKIINLVEGDTTDADKPTEADIMNMIRSATK